MPLFTSCSTSLTAVLLYLGEYRAPEEWNRELSWILGKGMGKTCKSKLRRLCMAAAAYYIWIARNKLLFDRNRKRTKWCKLYKKYKR
ncbi:hypothetical protein LIER_42698 [Lithospermum erythrorhizon]|uniref:Uncharacterized protein n=1 Tax=Lithospermum erythrorhizon TaxID=34254 RepID=A0AAV3NWD3_LITER